MCGQYCKHCYNQATPGAILRARRHAVKGGMSIVGYSRVRGRLAWIESLAGSRRIALAIVAAIHLTALAILYQTEWGVVHGALSLLAWGLLNSLWLLILRRPGLSAALSLAMMELLILLSQFKFDILWMGVSFFDFFVIDPDTVAFLLAITPKLGAIIVVAAVVAIPLLVVIWQPTRCASGGECR